MSGSRKLKICDMSLTELNDGKLRSRWHSACLEVCERSGGEASQLASKTLFPPTRLALVTHPKAIQLHFYGAVSDFDAQEMLLLIFASGWAEWCPYTDCRRRWDCQVLLLYLWITWNSLAWPLCVWSPLAVVSRIITVFSSPVYYSPSIFLLSSSFSIT